MPKERWILTRRTRKEHHQWDRFAFYIFSLLMRIRNCHNFSWWALCNSASQYCHPSYNMSTFFGIALSPSSMRKKIFDLKPYDSVMVDTIQTLKDSGKFGVAIFDNSQIFQTVKFQRKSQSSTASLATARCFVKPIIPSKST